MSLKQEYRVEVLGGSVISAKPEDLEAILNEAAEDGWEYLSVASQNNSARLWVILRRQRREPHRETRKRGSWFSGWR